MLQRKKNKTLVTEDELMEAVSALVTDNIRRELDNRFAIFERALDRITPNHPLTTEPGPEQPAKRTAEEDLQSHSKSARTAGSALNEDSNQNSLSSMAASLQSEAPSQWECQRQPFHESSRDL